MKFDDAFKYKLIYIFSIPDSKKHRGLLKIGETTIDKKFRAESLKPNCPALNAAAKKRIDEYTRTAAIDYKLLHTELAAVCGKSFRDYDIHRLLKKYRVKVKGFRGCEWFKVDLDTAINAIKKVKRKLAASIELPPDEFILRPEQEDAINQTVKYLRRSKDFLWNAKMRFGKTPCALEVVRRMNFAKTIIITHRPAVRANWFESFRQILGDDKNFICGSRVEGANLTTLLNSGKNFVYFASIQDLRGSENVGDKFDKNSAVFNTPWDFVIVDEAHEGTTTKLGDDVIKALLKPHSKRLDLSGTPFNILERYGDNVYTWDYVSEQRAKADWDKNHLDESNPYADLPRMNIYTYDLGEHFDYIDAQDKAFNFREFFRTTRKGKFTHEKDVKKFLDLLGMESDNNYPFSRPEFREIFKHTLWIIPGVKEGRALSELLKNHPAYCSFEVVNVAGDGDDDDNYSDALEKVQNAIADNECTITLSCGKLTTGVTVPEWTAVLYLAGGYYTSAASYLQTIFRVQNPCTLGGKVKENCFVFDFAPDRALKMITDAAAISPKAGKTKDGDREILGELLNFCPVISVTGSQMHYTADKLLRQLKRAWIDRAVRNGFDDTSLYNDNLLRLNDLDMEKFKALRASINSPAAQSKKDIVVNAQGFSDEKREKISTKSPRSPEQKEHDLRLRRRREAVSILRNVSIRMPLLIYGADVPLEENITIEKFTAIVDDASWEEFMPKGVTKEIFSDFIKYYDPEIFTGTGNEVRERAKAADALNPTERVKKIAELFATFKNPDKETVLTPWNVVKLHMDSVFDENFFTANKKILDINAKTGLYPLYVAEKIYRARLGNVNEDKISLDELRRIWDLTVAENIFAVCKTPMALKITRRTLLGYRQTSAQINARCFDDLINLLKTKPDDFIRSVTDKNFWNKGVGTMKFEAVVGNPPYQITTSTGNFNPPIYHEFIKIAYNAKLTDKATLIHPARFLFNAGATPKEFNEKFLQDKHVKLIKYTQKSWEMFPNTDIKGGIAITYYDADKIFEPITIFIPFDELIAIHKKVVLDNPNFRPLSEIVFSQTIYRLTKKFHEDNPAAVKIISEGHANDFSTILMNRFRNLFFDEKPDDGHEYIQVIGRQNSERIIKWFRSDWVTCPAPLTKWKVLVPKANGTGALGEVLVTPLVGSPLVGNTETFITIGAFDSELEARACHAYIKSKFCRVMLGILKFTQDATPEKWAKVPLQDFTSASDIDWSVSIAQIDAQLYRKYNLSAAEINFIETHVKAME